LWFGPALLLLLAGFGVWRMVRSNRNTNVTPETLTPEQLARAKALLDSTPDRS
jgi:cytochrome c-type biogenesis protein CcmH/NrfF